MMSLGVGPREGGHLKEAKASQNGAVRLATRVDQITLWVSVLLGAFLCVQILTFGYGRDQGIYAMVANAILHGKMPYRDAWDFKPPGIFIVYTFVRLIFGNAQIGIRIFEVLGLLAMCVALVRLAERFWNSRAAGFLAAFLALLSHTQLDFWHTAQPESFGGMLTVFAVYLCAKREDEAEPSRRAVLITGLLFGFAFLLKPPLAGGGAIIAAALGYRRYQKSAQSGLPLKARLRSSAFFAIVMAIGGAVPIVLCALWFWAKGALGDLYGVLFVFTPYYTKLGWEGSSVGGMFYWSFMEWLTGFCSALSIGVLIALGFGAEKEERPFLGMVLGIIAIQLVGVTMQGKFFPYHYGATWPLTALVAAFGYEKLKLRLRMFGVWGAATFGAVLLIGGLGRSATKDTPDSFMSRTRKRVMLLFGGFKDQTTLDGLASIADVSAADNRRAAEIIRERTDPTRPIFVWGFEPVIYDLSGRKPASRFLYNVPQRVSWSKEEMRKTLLLDLARNPPSALIVEHHDVFPMVTGDTIDSADTLYDFWDFYVFMQKYELIEKAEDLDIYIEKKPEAATAQ